MPVSAPLTVSELQLLNEELLAALRSGVSLDLGLRESARHLPGRMSRLANQLAGQIADGQNLSEALEHLDPPPPTVYRVLVAAGLRGNQLEAVLTRLNEFARVVGELKDSLRRAIVYPVAVFVMAYVLTCLTTLICVPPIRDFLTDLKAEPSLSVRILYALRETFPVWAIGIPAIILVLCLAGVVFDWAQSGTAGAFGFLRYIPGFGRLVRSSELARMAHLLSIQSEHGLPLPEALRRCAESVTDPQLRGFCRIAADRVENGESFGDSLTHSQTVPSFMKWMLSVPTSQAELVVNTRHAAELYRERTQLQAEWIARTVPMVLTLGFGTTIVGAYCWAIMETLKSIWEKVM